MAAAGDIFSFARFEKNCDYASLIHHPSPPVRVFDPLGQPTVTAGRDNCFRTCCLFIRPSVRPNFSNLAQNKATDNNGRY